ncbi:MAG: hypothetical protein JXJ22_14495 [Bacteroidales bacterium]|nr:hypothetical protein [Bacteroidales bacterium]
MKIYKIILGLLCITQVLHAQKDTVKIDFEYGQEIIDGKTTPKSTVISQKFLSVNDRLLREFFYDMNTGMLTKYIWYFYENNLPHTKEVYNSDNTLNFLIQYQYDPDGKKIKETEFVPEGEHVKKQLETIYSYQNNLLKSSQERDADNKLLRTTNLNYNNQGLTLNKSVKYKPRSPSEIKSKTIEYTYNDSGQISKKIIQIKNKNGSNKTEIVSFDYNEQGRLAAKNYTTEDGSLIKKFDYLYYPKGKISRFREFNKDSVLVNYSSYKYEIHQISKGTFESYLEKTENKKE